MTDESQDSSELDRVTVLARDFTPAAMEFHRREMGKQGYALAGPIVPHRFLLIDGPGEPKEVLGGGRYYAATFVRRRPAG